MLTIAVAALGLGFAFDRLFWAAPAGASVPLYATLVVVALVVVVRRTRPAPGTHHVLRADAGALLAPLAAVALGAAVRAAPVTALADQLLTVALLAAFTVSLGEARWPALGVRDAARATFALWRDAVAGGAGIAADAARELPLTTGTARRMAPYARGVALAVPVVGLLLGLLTTADPVFADRVAGAARALSLPDPAEALARTVLVVAVAYVLAGVLLHGVRDRPLRPLLAGMPLGPTLRLAESGAVLGAVNLLFAAFVAVQVRYFFGGAARVAAVDGLTYAEYARRGFGELVAVAVVSLGLLLALGSLTQRPTARQRQLFSALTAGVIGFVLVILTSSFQRLTLYEEAFGFTRLRTTVHIAIVWLAVLLVAVLVLELRQRLRAVPLAAAGALLGFVLTLNVVNVDALIVRHNVARAVDGRSLDIAYLNVLSADAVPTLVALRPTVPASFASELDAVLACLAARIDDDLPWQSATVARWRAQRALATVGVLPPCH
jgi:hypothetical protein